MKPMIEIDFKWPSEESGYRLFSNELENDPNILFHGTSEESAKSINLNGFHPTGNLSSSSFARTSEHPLGCGCEKRQNGSRGAVLAVKFETLNIHGIRQEGDVVYLDNPEMQPEIVAVCYIPQDYTFS